MTLNQLFVVIRARWRELLSAWILVVLLVMAVTFVKPPSYTATGSVVLDVKSPDPIAGVVLPGMTASSYMGTQLNVLQSERVIVQAIHALRLDADEEQRQAWRDATDGGKGSFDSWLSDRILRKLDATPARESNVMNVAYTARSPEAAARMVNAVVDAYIATTLELRVEPARRNNTFFDARAAGLREDLERAQQKLSAFQRQHGIVATDERLDVESVRLAELNSQWVMLGQQAAESSSRQQQSRGQERQMQEVLANPLLVSLTTELSKQESRLNELTSTLGDQHPQVTEARSGIARLKDRIAGETQRVASSVGMNDAIVRERVVKLRAEIEGQRSRILALRTQRDQAVVLQRDVESARTAYDNVTARATQAAMESQATQTNVSVLKRATEPALPSSPKVILNAAVAAIVGLFLGIVYAIWRELRDPRLRMERDVIDGLRQPLLAVLPRHAALGRTGRLRLRLTAPAAKSVSR